MSSWLTFVVGVILGLLAGWVLDLLWRRRAGAPDDLEPSAVAAPERAAPLPGVAAEAAGPEPPALAAAAVAVAEAEVPTEPPLAEAGGQPETLEQQPDWPTVCEHVAEVTEPAEEAPAAAPHIADELPGAEGPLPPAAVAVLAASEAESDQASTSGARDKLILIEGIGPVYETKLNAAGIYTFRQMVAAGPERLREIIQPQGWQRVNFGEWIEQAQLLAEGKDEELKELQARLFRRKKP